MKLIYIIIYAVTAIVISEEISETPCFHTVFGNKEPDICDDLMNRCIMCICDYSHRLGGKATEAMCTLYNGTEEETLTTLAGQPHLQKLILQVHNDVRLKQVVSEIHTHLPKLHSLKINGNFSRIETWTFLNSSTWNEISLPQNEIEVLESYSFVDLTNLTAINLEHNMITEISADIFENVPKLELLDLSMNSISYIAEKAFYKSRNLTWLNLSNNNLQQIEKNALYKLDKLQILDLSNNRIQQLDDFTFKDLSDVTRIQLENNDIKSISQRAFYGMHKLVNLSLEGNKISTLPSFMFRFTLRVSYLNLEGNILNTLTKDVMDGIIQTFKKSNSSLLLTGNNFVCDLRLKWMYQLYFDTESQSTKDSLWTIISKCGSNLPDITTSSTENPNITNKTTIEDNKNNGGYIVSSYQLFIVCTLIILQYFSHNY